MRDWHTEGIVCFHNTLLSSCHSLRAPWSNRDSEKPSCSVEEQFPLCGPRADSMSFHARHEFVQQAVLQISALQPRNVCEWRQSKDDKRPVTKQAGTVTNCQHRYTLGKMFWGTEELWTESSWDLTQLSQQFISLRTCHPDPNAKRSQTNLPSWKSESKPEQISSWLVSERKRRYHHFLYNRRFSNLFKKRNLEEMGDTKYFPPLPFFREILVNALRKTEPTYTHICTHTVTLLGDVILCRLPLLFLRTRQLSWSQRGFTLKDDLIWRKESAEPGVLEVGHQINCGRLCHH